jgi:large subunit ribosomal protein L35
MLLRCLQAQALSSRRCGINAAPKISAAVALPRATPVCTAIECKHKLKTRSAMAKRYKVTGSGKVMRRHAGKQHCNEKKAHKRLKRLGKEESVFIGDVRSCRSFPVRKFRLHRVVEVCGSCWDILASGISTMLARTTCRNPK